MTTANTFKALPGVLSIRRGIILSDALFMNDFDGSREPTPVLVTRHGIRGTQNVAKGDAKKDGDTAGSGAKRKVSNPQFTDSAKLDTDAIGLLVVFNIRFSDIAKLMEACASAKTPTKDTGHLPAETFSAELRKFLERAKDSEALAQLAQRYARNIVNGRFLWRNRAEAEAVEVTVRQGESDLGMFDALSYDLNSFDNPCEAEKSVAAALLAEMQGKGAGALTVQARVDFGVGGGVEVYPSQNYVEKQKGFARSLYVVGHERDTTQPMPTARLMGQAALRDQKVSNALRTFDTWYPSFAQTNLALAVEPQGASLSEQAFFRADKKSDAFSLLLEIPNLELNDKSNTSSYEAGMFLLACLIRGGVYSGSAS